MQDERIAYRPERVYGAACQLRKNRHLSPDLYCRDHCDSIWHFVHRKMGDPPQWARPPTEEEPRAGGG